MKQTRTTRQTAIRDVLTCAFRCALIGFALWQARVFLETAIGDRFLRRAVERENEELRQDAAGFDQAEIPHISEILGDITMEEALVIGPVLICLTNGSVTIHPGVTMDEASRAFWSGLAGFLPQLQTCSNNLVFIDPILPMAEYTIPLTMPDGSVTSISMSELGE